MKFRTGIHRCEAQAMNQRCDGVPREMLIFEGKVTSGWKQSIIVTLDCRVARA